MVCSAAYDIVCVWHVKHTCNNSLVFHDTLQVARAQFIKGFIGGSEQSKLARLVQFVHHARGQQCSLGNKTGECVSCGWSKPWCQKHFNSSWCCCCWFHTTYIEGGEVIRDIQGVLDGVSHSADDPIDHMHHSVCGHLVTVDDPGTVYCHNLHTQRSSWHGEHIITDVKHHLQTVIFSLWMNRPHLDSGWCRALSHCTWMFPSCRSSCLWWECGGSPCGSEGRCKARCSRCSPAHPVQPG